MASQFINVAKVGRDLNKINKTIARIEDIATTKALNQLAKDEKKLLGDQISKEFGVLKGSYNRRVKVVKATKKNKRVLLISSSVRTNFTSPRKIRGGVSHIGRGPRRKKITDRPRSGSTKTFLITATAGKFGTVAGGDTIKMKGGGGKKLAAYRAAGSKRRVIVMKGPSIAKLMREIGIKEKQIEKNVLKNFPKEYRKQLKNAKRAAKFASKK